MRNELQDNEMCKADRAQARVLLRNELENRPLPWGWSGEDEVTLGWEQALACGLGEGAATTDPLAWRGGEGVAVPGGVWSRLYGLCARNFMGKGVSGGAR